MKVNQLKWGTVLSYVSLILGTLVSLLYTPVMLQQLGQSEYGVYNLVLPVVSYLNLLSFGLGSAYTRYYSRYKVEDDRRAIARLNGMFIVLYSLLGLLVLCIGCFLAENVQFLFGSKLTADELALSRILMYIMSVNAALSFPISVFESNVMVNEQYLFQKIVALGKTVFNPLLMIPLLLMGFRSVAMTVLTLTFTVVSGALNVVYCLRVLKMRFLFNRFDMGLMKEMFSYTSYVFISILVDQLNWSVDKLLLGRFHGTSAVAVYTVASQLNLYFMSMSTALSSILTPKVHRMVASGASNTQLTALFTRVGRLQFIVLSAILVGFVAVGQPFVIQWSGGAEYAPAFWMALLLMVPTVIPSIQTIGIEIQRAKNMHKFRSVVYLGVALLNILLSIPLTKYWQGIGASVGTAISVILGNCILMNWYYHNYIGLNIRRFWKQIARLLPSLVLPLTAALLIANFAHVSGWGGIVLWGCVIVAVFLPSMWLLGMNGYEKELVREPLRGIARRLRRHK